MIDGTLVEPPLTEMEYWIKFVTSRCRRCGDCTLEEMAFLCPQSQCPKSLFNGQCGGSSEGWCEVFPGTRRCIFVRAYDRLKAYGEERSLGGEYIRPRNWALDQTSSWANYFWAGTIGNRPATGPPRSSGPLLRLCRRNADQNTNRSRPPIMFTIAPVIYAALSETAKAMASAISSGSAGLRRAILFSNLSRIS